MKLARLYQPRNPLFWLMIVFNLLSYALAWVLRSYDLAPALAVILALFALGNVAFGLVLMWRLLQTPDE
jgi:hypothetical protein